MFKNLWIHYSSSFFQNSIAFVSESESVYSLHSFRENEKIKEKCKRTRCAPRALIYIYIYILRFMNNHLLSSCIYCIYIYMLIYTIYIHTPTGAHTFTHAHTYICRYTCRYRYTFCFLIYKY